MKTITIKPTLKPIAQSLLLSVAAATILLGSGCTRAISENITDDGQVASTDLIFPELEDAWQTEGQFPNRENLSKIKPGIAKDELYQLVGRPHFSEAQYAREWDYIFKFYQPDDSVKICQYKVIFDTDYRGQQFYWSPSDCAKYAAMPQPQTVIVEKPAPTPIPVQIVNEKINLAADALFEFNKWRTTDMKPQGVQSINNLAEKLRDYQTRGDTRVIITGYTDRLGDDMYNLNLSQLRAQTVREHLIRQGVDASIMTAAGAGEASPVKQCSDNQPRQALIECLQPNRRVEVAVVVYATKQ